MISTATVYLIILIQFESSINEERIKNNETLHDGLFVEET